MTARHAGLAPQLAALAQQLTGRPLAFKLRAYDGSEAGPEGPPSLEITSPTALRRMVWNRGELGIAEAYVADELRVHGDLFSLLHLLRDNEGESRAGDRRRRLGIAAFASAARLALAAKALGPRPPVPTARAKVTGRRHSRARDKAVIAFHYDLSNDFFKLLLDPEMCFSCGYWTSSDPHYGLADAQRDKLDLVCRRLDLKPGMRLLDIGCGWGSLVHHASTQYGVTATGVTLSTQQAQYARQRTMSDGSAEIRLIDYRDIDEEPYDAVSVIEMAEHVGASQYPAFAGRVARLLKPGGRLVLQQMSRRPDAPDGGPFIASYIAPDLHMPPLPETLAILQNTGLEIVSVEGMRKHYARTFRAWRENLNTHFTEVTEILGPQGARVWQLFLAAGELAFEHGTTGVDQIVAQRR